MSSKDNGGPAFPRPYSEKFSDGRHQAQVGMTLRDYFAATAPITMSDAIDAMKSTAVENFTGAMIMEMLALMRWQYADAMLEARKQ